MGVCGSSSSSLEPKMKSSIVSNDYVTYEVVLPERCKAANKAAEKVKASGAPPIPQTAVS